MREILSPTMIASMLTGSDCSSAFSGQTKDIPHSSTAFMAKFIPRLVNSRVVRAQPRGGAGSPISSLLSRRFMPVLWVVL